MPSTQLESHPHGVAAAARGIAPLIALQADLHGARTFLEYAHDGRSLSFLDVSNLTTSWTREVRGIDMHDEVLVAVALADPIEFAAVFLSLLAAGHWVLPFDPAAFDLDAPKAVATALGLGAQLLVTDQPSAQGLGLATRPPPDTSTSRTTAPDDTVDFSDDRGGVLLSSSGTTGAPKSIRLGIGQLLRTAELVAGQLELTTDDRGLCPLPLFHINAEVVGLLASLTAGSTLVLEQRFHRSGFWDTVARQRITWINAVPAIVTLLANLAPEETVSNGVRFIRSASAPLAPETLAAFEAATGIPVVESYGMTEAASQITANPVGGLRKAGSAGLPVGVDLRIEPGAEGSIGEVQIKGPTVVTRYEGDRHPERFTSDGWLRTGDIGRIDDDGYLFLLGRADDVINRSGEKVFPREIEEVLASDHTVGTAVVVARSDPVLGQVPVAYLLPDDPALWSDPDRVRDLARRLEDRLARSLVRTKRPAELHLVAALPTGPTGKILRRALADVTPVTTIRLPSR